VKKVEYPSVSLLHSQLVVLPSSHSAQLSHALVSHGSCHTARVTRLVSHGSCHTARVSCLNHMVLHGGRKEQNGCSNRVWVSYLSYYLGM